MNFEYPRSPGEVLQNPGITGSVFSLISDAEETLRQYKLQRQNPLEVQRQLDYVCGGDLGLRRCPAGYNPREDRVFLQQEIDRRCNKIINAGGDPWPGDDRLDEYLTWAEEYHQLGRAALSGDEAEDEEDQDSGIVTTPASPPASSPSASSSALSYHSDLDIEEEVLQATASKAVGQLPHSPSPPQAKKRVPPTPPQRISKRGRLLKEPKHDINDGYTSPIKQQRRGRGRGRGQGTGV